MAGFALRVCRSSVNLSRVVCADGSWCSWTVTMGIRQSRPSLFDELRDIEGKESLPHVTNRRNSARRASCDPRSLGSTPAAPGSNGAPRRWSLTLPSEQKNQPQPTFRLQEAQHGFMLPPPMLDLRARHQASAR